MTFAGMFWSEHRAEQIASAEREKTMMEPASVDDAIIGHEALISDFRGRVFAYDLRNGKRRLGCQSDQRRIANKAAVQPVAWRIFSCLCSSLAIVGLSYSTAWQRSSVSA